MDDKTKLGVAREALQWAYEMFLARDQMNSKVHCAPVRLSPITERIKIAMDALDNTLHPFIAENLFNEHNETK